MTNSSSTYKTIFDVPELKYTALATQIKQFKLDGNTSNDVVWLALERIARLPEKIEPVQKNNKKEIKEEKEFSKKETVDYIREKLGLPEIATMVNDTYKESTFKNVNWEHTDVDDEQIKRLQGINPNLIE